MSAQTILYVEDEENDVIFMRHACERAGLAGSLQVATDGEEALKYFSGEGQYANRDAHPLPCLVLLDLKLPKLSGLEVLKWIREHPALYTLRVLILSSSNQPLDIHAAYARGANAFLVKPSNVDELAAMAASVKDFWLTRAQTPPECLLFKDEFRQR